jgi:hypothetical protein
MKIPREISIKFRFRCRSYKIQTSFILIAVGSVCFVVILMLEAAGTSETSVSFCETSWSNIPKDVRLHTPRNDNPCRYILCLREPHPALVPISWIDVMLCVQTQGVNFDATETWHIERRRRVASTPASCLEGPGFRSQPGDWLCLLKNFRRFPQSLQAISVMIPYIRSRPHSFVSFPVRYSLIIL